MSISFKTIMSKVIHYKHVTKSDCIEWFDEIFSDIFELYPDDDAISDVAYDFMIKREPRNVKGSISYPQNKFLEETFAKYINNYEFDFSGAVKRFNSILLKNKAEYNLGDVMLMINQADWNFDSEIDNMLKTILKKELSNNSETDALLLLVIISLYLRKSELKPLFMFLSMRYPEYNLEKWITADGEVRLPSVKKDKAEKDNSEHIADNHNFTVFDKALKFTAMEMQKRAHEDCRLLPYSNDKNERMELPTLNVDSTISNSDTNEVVLSDLLKDSTCNIMITGTGGCGKTYSLLCCAEQILSLKDNNADIPLYIPLNTFNGSDFKGIEEYVIGKLKAYFDNDYSKAEQVYNKFISEYGKNGRKLIFLCDGFNEVISKELQSRIVQNIRELQHNYIFRFVITSRYNLSSTFADYSGDVSNFGFSAYKVNNLADNVVIEYVETYLQGQKLTNKQINKIIDSELCETAKDKVGHSVKDIYKKPMALVMFCGLHSSSAYNINNPDFYSKIRKLGELLHDFIMCVKLGNRNSSESKDNHYLFLKYLGYRMNVDGVFTVSKYDFDTYCEDFIKQFGLSKLTAQEIFHNSLVNDVLKYESVENGIVASISFNHQNFRDYFAAAFLREFIYHCDFNRVNEFIGIEKKIPNETSILLAELLGEYKVVEQQNAALASESVIQKILSKSAGRLTPTAIAYLISVAVIGRKNNLSQFDFSGLDLSLAKLNGVDLSVGSGKERIKSVFDDAIVTKETFAPIGHAGAPLALCYAENRYIISFSKNTVCSFDMETGVQRIVAEYSEDVINSAVTIKETRNIITGDSSGILSLWEYNVQNNVLSLTLIRQLSILDSVNISASDEVRKKVRIQDICTFVNETILFTVSGGEIFAVDNNLSTKPVLKTSLCASSNEYNRFCRVKCKGNDFYVSYGKKLFKNNSDMCFTIPSDSGNGCIYDFLLVNIEGSTVIIVNFRGDKNNPSTATSILYKFDEALFNNADSKKADEIRREYHSASIQGFTGWNRFSLLSDNGSCAYLCANTNDDVMNPGVYRLSFKPVYDEDDEIEDICVSYEAVFGNKHVMSVECALPFVFNSRKYLATSSIDRSVEVLDISGTENTLIYNLPGYTDGVTCIKVVDSKNIYTSHYSGEVCRWHKNKSDKWTCSIISKPHFNWVWTVDLLKNESTRYIVGGSYDHCLSLTNDKTGGSIILSDCKGTIKSMEIIDNSVVVAYDYKADNKSIYDLAVFYDIDFETGNSKFQSINAPGSGFVRCMKKYANELFLCVNSNLTTEIFSIKIDKEKNGTMVIVDSENMLECTSKHIIKSEKNRTLIRAIDVIDFDSNRFFACGGNIGDYFIEIWNEQNKSSVVIQNRPSFVSTTNNSYDENDGVSTIKFMEYNSELYLIVGAFDYHTYIYKLSYNGKKMCCNEVSVIEHSDKVMNIQIDDLLQLYVSLFNGKVYVWNFENLVKSGNKTIDESSGELLFHAVTGLHIMGVDFTSINDRSSIPDDFKHIMKYYGTI